MKIASAEFVKGIRGTDPILSDPLPQVAFIGRSNVGKSSIINSLTGRKDLVKVSDKPGKTTEINFFKIDRKLYLVDLPGYGYAKTGPREREKLAKLILWYLMESDVRPRLIVLILDAKAGFTEFDREVLGVLRDKNHAYVIAVNKIDKLNRKELAEQLTRIRAASREAEIIPCSTVAKGGLRELETRVFA